MTTCLSDAELRQFVDGGLAPDRRPHADSCALCRARAEAQHAAEDAFADLVAGIEVPSGLGERVRAAILRAQQTRGATTLRRAVPGHPGLRRLVPLALGAAVVVVVVFALLPRLGAPTELSASEVLGRSAQALVELSGVEQLEYDLRVEGFRPSQLSPTEGTTFVIHQIIDHATGRFLVARYAEDGTLAAGIAEDPAGGLRTMVVSAYGRRYVARLALPAGPRRSLPEAVRTIVRTWLGVVQASGARNLSLATTAEGQQVVVQAAGPAAAGGDAWAMQGARIVVDAHDYHIVALDARGQLFGRPYRVSFKLRERRLDATAPDSDFVLPSAPDDVILDGEASDNPLWDVSAAALRRLGQAPR